jgi:hypothetical protein
MAGHGEVVVVAVSSAGTETVQNQWQREMAGKDIAGQGNGKAGQGKERKGEAKAE